MKKKQQKDMISATDLLELLDRSYYDKNKYTPFSVFIDNSSLLKNLIAYFKTKNPLFDEQKFVEQYNVLKAKREEWLDKQSVHKFKRLSGYFGQSITMCDKRLSNAEYAITKDDKIVTCEGCKIAMRKEFEKGEN